MISIENGLFFLLKRIQKLAPPPHTFVFLCKGMHVLKPARLQVYSFDTVRGDLVVWDRHYPDVIPTFLQHFFLFVVFFVFSWERSYHHHHHLPSPVFCFPVASIFFSLFLLHARFSLESWFPFACENAELFFYLLQAYLSFFNLSRLSQHFFYFIFFQTVHHPPKKKKKKGAKKKKLKRSKNMVHGGDESTTWLMLCPNPRQRKCSCSAKTQIWRLCSRKPKS